MLLLIKRFLSGLLISFLMMSFAAGTDISPKINIDVKEFTLGNGMLFLIVNRPASPQIACRIAIRAGSALEESGKTGIAHLLEHMMFKGTKNFGTLDADRDQILQNEIESAYQMILKEKQKRNPDSKIIEKYLNKMNHFRHEVQKIYIPQAFSSQLGKNGAVHINAFTSTDQTQYTASVPSDMIEQWFSIISEQLFEPSWREFYVEKEVVLREWSHRYINNPAGTAWLDLKSTAYTAHPYRNPTIGWKSDMKNFNTDDAIDFHEKYYNPSNAVCVLVGDITLKKARQLAKVYFTRYPRGDRSTESVTQEPEQNGPRKSIRYLKGARTPLVRIGFHTARMGTRDFYALDALSMILSEGRSSRMSQNITNKGFALQAWAYHPDNRYGGMVLLGGSPNDPNDSKDQPGLKMEKQQRYLKSCEDLEKRLLKEVENIKNEPVSYREMSRFKKLNEWNFLNRIRTNESLADSLATLEVQVGWRYFQKYLENIALVTPDEIMNAAQKYLHPKNMTSVYVIPGGSPDHPPEAYSEIRNVRSPETSRNESPNRLYNHSVFPTPEKWKHPLSFNRKPQKINYPQADTSRISGATIFFLQNAELPLIDLTLFIKAGAVDLKDHEIGLTSLLEKSLIRGGTLNLSPALLAREMDENAIDVSISINDEITMINLSVLKEDWEKGLLLLKDIMTQPRFDHDILQVVKNQELTSLKRKGEDARTVAQQEAINWHFKEHPYGRDPLIGLKTIPKLTEEDLKLFAAQYFLPSNMTVAISGDISENKVLNGLKTFFKSFPPDKSPTRNLETPLSTPPVLSLIHKPGQVQSEMILCLPSIKRTHPSYWKMSLLSSILGGNDSMMYTRLRDDLGLVYSTGFYQTYKWNAGFLIGYIGCRGDKTRRAISETVKLMESLQKDIPVDKLEQKRLDILNGFVFNVDSPFELAKVYSQYFIRKEPLDTLDNIQDSFLSASRKELKELAENFLEPSMLQIFIVCDKTIKVNKEDGSSITLEQDLKASASELKLPYREIILK